MKLSLLALLLTAVILSGCKDEQLSSKLLETEKKVAKLEADLQQSQQVLATKDRELTQFQLALAQQKQTIPALTVKSSELFNQSNEIKHIKDPNDEFYRESTPISVSANMLETGIEWIDNQLLLAYLSKEQQAGLTHGAEIKIAVLKSLQEEYQSQEKDAKEFKSIGHESSYHTYYVGQREHIATFQQFFYQYSGGAHGMHQTTYLHFDGKKKARLTLNDLVSADERDALKEMLWEVYLSKLSEQDREITEPFMPKSEFFISENFYFVPNGINFVYPLYSLASYAEGEIELFLTFPQLKEVMNPDYLPE